MRSGLIRSVAGTVAVAASLLCVASAGAATIAPTSGSDDGTGCTLREAIESANTDADFGGCVASGSYTSGGADTIQLTASTTYNITFNDIPDYGEDANVKGDFDIVAGAGLTIQGAGTDASRSTIEGNSVDRIFHILGTSTGPVAIDDVILDHGRADHIMGETGGAILNQGGDLTVSGSALTFNSAGAGGAGIETTGSATTQIADSSFTDNNQCCDTTTTGGGAIDVSSGGGGSLTITNSEIGASGDANQAQSGTSPARGGGISFAPTSSATLSVTDSRIVGNNTGSNGGGAEGGGVYIGGATGSTIDFTRTLIDSNTTGPITPTDTARGAGVYIDGPGPAVTLSDSLITGNSGFAQSGVADEGGGVYINSSSGAVRLVDTTVASNSFFGGVRSGAGIYNKGTLVLLNSTVAGNSASSGTGGGLTQAAGSATIVNATFTGNGASTAGAGIAQTGGTVTVRGSIVDNECSGTIGTGGFNVSSENSCWDTAGSDLANADPALGALQSNGGPDVGGTTGGDAQPLTTTEPDLASSDAIDRIPATSCTGDSSTPLTLDQRGFPRPIDGNGDLTDACDSGAVEVAACDGTEATIVGTNGGDTTLDGTGGPDVIVGAGGNDTIDGGAGGDTICGGAGNDHITGGDGVDQIFGGPGADTILSQDGLADTINCTGGGPDSGTVDTSPAETYVGCDADGDGVVDFLDACPTQAGTGDGCPVSTPPPPSSGSSGPTGQRAAALKKCKKKKSAKARKKCKKKANKLPV
jgi:CSLREA domain-containing protein